MSRFTYEVELNCGHTNNFYPRPYFGDTVYCQKCANFSVVIGGKADNHKLRIKCEHCRYRKTYAATVEEITLAAETHTLKYDHVVIVSTLDGGVITVTKP